MRENLTLLFCLLAGFALIFGKASQPPDLTRAYAAYQSAVDRGDMRRAARYGELALAGAERSPLFDRAGIARLRVLVGGAQAKAGNPQRAHELYQLALAGFDDGAHSGEAADAKAKLGELDRLIAERSLRGTVGANGPGG